MTVKPFDDPSMTMRLRKHGDFAPASCASSSSAAALPSSMRDLALTPSETARMLGKLSGTPDGYYGPVHSAQLLSFQRSSPGKLKLVPRSTLLEQHIPTIGSSKLWRTDGSLIEPSESIEALFRGGPDLLYLSPTTPKRKRALEIVENFPSKPPRARAQQKAEKALKKAKEALEKTNLSEKALKKAKKTLEEAEEALEKANMLHPCPVHTFQAALLSLLCLGSDDEIKEIIEISKERPDDESLQLTLKRDSNLWHFFPENQEEQTHRNDETFQNQVRLWAASQDSPEEAEAWIQQQIAWWIKRRQDLLEKRTTMIEAITQAEIEPWKLSKEDKQLFRSPFPIVFEMRSRAITKAHTTRRGVPPLRAWLRAHNFSTIEVVEEPFLETRDRSTTDSSASHHSQNGLSIPE